MSRWSEQLRSAVRTVGKRRTRFSPSADGRLSSSCRSSKRLERSAGHSSRRRKGIFDAMSSDIPCSAASSMASSGFC